MSVFDDPASLRGQSFGYALAPLDPLAEDSETFATSWPVAIKSAVMALAECSPLLFTPASREPMLATP